MGRPARMARGSPVAARLRRAQRTHHRVRIREHTARPALVSRPPMRSIERGVDLRRVERARVALEMRSVARELRLHRSRQRPSRRADTYARSRCRHLASFRRNAPDASRELRVLRAIDRSVPRLRARRIVSEKIVVLPVAGRPHRTRHESSTAIRTHVQQHVVDTLCAERALVRADPRLEAGWGQRLVAMLTRGSELQHEVPRLLHVNQILAHPRAHALPHREPIC